MQVVEEWIASTLTPPVTNTSASPGPPLIAQKSEWSMPEDLPKIEMLSDSDRGLSAQAIHSWTGMAGTAGINWTVWPAVPSRSVESARVRWCLVLPDFQSAYMNKLRIQLCGPPTVLWRSLFILPFFPAGRLVSCLTPDLRWWLWRAKKDEK